MLRHVSIVYTHGYDEKYKFSYLGPMHEIKTRILCVKISERRMYACVVKM